MLENASSEFAFRHTKTNSNVFYFRKIGAEHRRFYRLGSGAIHTRQQTSCQFEGSVRATSNNSPANSFHFLRCCRFITHCIATLVSDDRFLLLCADSGQAKSYQVCFQFPCCYFKFQLTSHRRWTIQMFSIHFNYLLQSFNKVGNFWNLIF